MKLKIRLRSTSNEYVYVDINYGTDVFINSAQDRGGFWYTEDNERTFYPWHSVASIEEVEE